MKNSKESKRKSSLAYAPSVKLSGFCRKIAENKIDNEKGTSISLFQMSEKLFSWTKYTLIRNVK